LKLSSYFVFKESFMPCFCNVYKLSSSLIVPPSKKNQSELDPGTKSVVQSAFNIQFTCEDRSRSITAGHFPHSSLELSCAETTTSASQLEAYLQALPIGQFRENHDIAEQLSRQAADRAPRQCPDNFSPNVDSEAD
jgi:hypothetical protein